MFYVSSTKSPDIEMSKVVQKKLGKDEVCLQCVECAHIIDGQRNLRYAAVVECVDEYGIFLFKTNRVPCLQSSDLDLVKVIAIDSSLHCHAEAPTKTEKHQADLILTLHTEDMIVLLELTLGEVTQLFLADLKRAQDLHSMNAAFGSPSSFTWLEKYRRICEKSTIPTSQTMQSNPFAEDTFDPMKHMNLATPGGHVLATDVAASTQSVWYPSETSNLSISDIDTQKSPSLTRKLQSQSRESLDKISNKSLDMTDSMDNIQSHLGIGLGFEMTGSGKPMSYREKMVQHYLFDREEEFTDIKNFKVFCGTWNVNGQSPQEALHKWMVCDSDPPDIYAIGFQELDLSKEAYVFSASAKEAEWQKAVKSYLHPKVKYRKVTSVRLVGVLLIVYIQEKHVPYVKAIDTGIVATGIMGFVGNKGGVSIRFNLHSTSLCFVNCHLAAHQSEYERRNQDYRDIESKLKFKQFEPPLEISEHDAVFWIGDLNYRIDLPIDDVKACIKKGMYKRLLEGDQLKREMSLSNVFLDYEEGDPLFDPTYRYDVGTDHYDTSEKLRNPAWCDRVLWRKSKNTEVTQLRYDAHPQLRVSDHKPVSSLFKLGVGVIDQTRYKSVYEDIMKKVDRMENDKLPQIKLDKTELNFENVKFLQAQTQSVAIANIGQGGVDFEFINKLDDKTYCRPWLKVTPSKSMIMPGSCCEVQIEVYVDKDSAARLNSGIEKMEDILVLHLNGGKDSFITISGNYHVSSFGSSIEALVQTNGPIREVPVATLIEIEQPGSLSRVDIAQDGGRLYMVPKEIWKLVDFIYEHGLDKEELFQQPGLNSEIEQIRDILDTGKPELIPSSFSVHSVAEALLLFLECLSQSVVPQSLYNQALGAAGNPMLCKRVVSQLPDCHKNVFLYINAFLRDLLQHTYNNGLEIKLLANMFGEILLRPLSSSPIPVSNKKEKKSKIRDDELKKTAFMSYFLRSDYDD